MDENSRQQREKAGGDDPRVSLPSPPSTKLKRHFERAVLNSEFSYSILDEALMGHFSTVVNGFPVIIPTTFVRLGDRIYLHGAKKNRAFNQASGTPSCFEVAILDGLVFASISFNHSMNYRSIVVYDVPVEVTDFPEKIAAMDALIERFEIGRSKKLRPSSESELTSTILLRLSLKNSSTKVRSGPPTKLDENLGENTFVGTVSTRMTFADITPANEATELSVEIPEKLRAK